MDKARASHLFESGRSHALAADLLYRSALAEGVANGVKDPADYAFNGSYSLSTFYLLGLGLELMLKAANYLWPLISMQRMVYVSYSK